MGTGHYECPASSCKPAKPAFAWQGMVKVADVATIIEHSHALTQCAPIAVGA